MLKILRTRPINFGHFYRGGCSKFAFWVKMCKIGDKFGGTGGKSGTRKSRKLEQWPTAKPEGGGRGRDM